MIIKMKHPRMLTPEGFALRAGLILMAAPSFFWLGVVLAVFFEKPLIVEQILLPMDRVSSILTMLIMIGLPVITILVNLKSMMWVEYSHQYEEVPTGLKIQRSPVQWMLIAYAAATVAITFCYFFFEKFVFFSDHHIH